MKAKNEKPQKRAKAKQNKNNTMYVNTYANNSSQ